MTQEEKIQYWVEISENDLKAAEVLLGGGQYLYVGFMCHQAIEKIFKACYQKKEMQIPPYIHKLIRLAELADIKKMLDNAQLNHIYMIEPLNIEARYPTYKESIAKSLTQEICTNLLHKTKELVKWTKETILSTK